MQNLNNDKRPGLVEPRKRPILTIRDHVTSLLHRALRDSKQILALFVLLLAIFLARWWVLAQYSTPPSEDLAGDLAVLNAYLGSNIRPFWSQQSPPIYYFLFLLPLISIFPMFVALKIVAALMSTIIGLPFYLLLRKLHVKFVPALVATGLFTFAEAYNEMIGWGGTLNFAGIFFALFFFGFLAEFIERRDRKSVFVTAIAFGLTAGTHWLTATYSFLVFVVYVSYWLWRDQDSPVLRKRVAELFAAMVVSVLPFTYVYLYVYANRVNVAQAPTDLGTWAYAWFWMPLSLTRNAVALLVLLAVLGILLTFFLFWYRHSGHRALVLALTLAALLLSLLLNSATYDRVSYFLPIPIFVAFAMFLNHLRGGVTSNPHALTPRRIAALSLVVLVVAVFPISSYQHLRQAVEYYHYLSDDAIQALNWIAQNTPSNTTIYTDYPTLSTWIVAYSNRDSIQPRPPGYLVTAPDLADALIANSIALGNIVFLGKTLTTADMFPGGYYNPAIYLDPEGQPSRLFFLTDDFATFQFSDATSPSRISNLGSGLKTVQSVDPTNSAASLSYSWNFASLTKTLAVDNQLTIGFSLNVTNGVINTLRIPIILDQGTAFARDSNGNPLLVSIGDPTPISFRINASSSDALDVSIMYTERDNSTRLPTLWIAAGYNSSRATLQVTIKSDGFGQGASQVSSFWESSAARQLRFFAIDARDYVQIARFNAMWATLTKVFSNGSIHIFRLLA